MNIPNIDVLFTKGIINYLIEWIYKDMISFLITLLVILIIFVIVLGYVMQVDEIAYNIFAYLLLTFLFFSLIMLFDKGIIKIPIGGG